MPTSNRNHTAPATAAPDVAREAHEALQAFGLLSQWNVALASLYARRWQELATLPWQMMQCVSADDLSDLQVSYARGIMADYRAAAGNLAAIMKGASADNSAAESYAETLLKAQADAREIIDQAKAQAKKIAGETDPAGGTQATERKVA